MYDTPPPEIYFILADVSSKDVTATPFVELFKDILHNKRNISRGGSSMETKAFSFCRYMLSAYVDNPDFFIRACRNTGHHNLRSAFKYLHTSGLYTPTTFYFMKERHSNTEV